MSVLRRAKYLRKTIEGLSVNLNDTDALKNTELFPAWSDSADYTADVRVRYNNVLYKCLQNHTSQPSWTPDVSPSLWVRVDDPSQEWPEWIQPVGSTDAYAAGAKVNHNNKHWISDYDANIWEPGVYGWTEQN